MKRPYLYVMDDLAGVDPDGDTTFDFLLESQSRDVPAFVCSISDIYSQGAQGYARAQPVQVRRPNADDKTHCSFSEQQTRSFNDFAAIWMRKDPPVDDAFILSTMILDRYDPAQTLMMNEPSSLRVANEKLWALFADELGPESVVSARADILVSAVERWGRGVLKPVSLAGGAGVMVFESGDRNLRAAADVLTENGRVPAIVQAYLDDVRQGDKRVILLGGEPIGAVLRVPQANDNRANMHVGGGVQQVEIDDHDRRIAKRIGPQLKALGIHFAGLDVIGGQLTEVNVTSPTGVQEIDRLDGRTGHQRMSAMVMNYVEALLKERGIPQ